MHVSVSTSLSVSSYFLNICTCFAGDVAEDIPGSGFKSPFMHLLSTSLSGASVSLCISTENSQVHDFLCSTDLLPHLSGAHFLALQDWVSNSSSFTLTITFMTRQTSVTPAFSPN